MSGVNGNYSKFQHYPQSSLLQGTAILGTLATITSANGNKAAQAGQVIWADGGVAGRKIASVDYSAGAVTAGTGVWRTSLQSLSTVAQGAPSGTILGVGNSAYVDGAVPTANTMNSATLGTAVLAPQGTYLAVVHELSTAGAGTSVVVQKQQSGTVGFPWVSVHNGAAWQTPTTLSCPNIMFTGDDGALGYLSMAPVATTTSLVYSNGADPTRHANVITLPFDCVCIGAYFGTSFSALGADADIVLRDSNKLTGSLASTSFKAAYASGISTNRFHEVFWAATPLQRGQTVYLSLEAASADARTLASYTNSTAARFALHGVGTNVSYTSYSGGAYAAPTANAMIVAGLILADTTIAGAGAYVGEYTGSY